jgi:DNA-binding GntR family transcriptional regulator
MKRTVGERKTSRSILESPARPRGKSSHEVTPLSQIIERENLDDKIYAQLRSLIMDRRILPGERIPVDRLAREMGVSRTPVVNALKRLAQEQIVEWASHRGIYVRYLTQRELARLFEVREVLEGLSARLAASRITPEEVDQLTAIFKGLDLTPHGPALQRYIERDRYFHLRLLEIAGNRPLAHAMNSVNLMIFTYQMGLARPPAETIEEHWAILAALGKHDPEASERAMRLHLARSRDRLDQEADVEEGHAPGPAIVRETTQEADTVRVRGATGKRR